METEEFIKKEELKQIPSFLKSVNLLEIINKEFDKKIVEEKETRKAIFICGCGAWVKNLNATFNILINGESSAGKSWVCKNVLNIFPESVFSKKTYRTRISPRALTYWHNSKVEPEWNWDGKILYLEDVGYDILNSDVFKVMISEGSIATIVGRKKGRGYEIPATYDIEIQGKPITFITTATNTPIEEIKNRFLMIDLDESEKQTDKIMEKQLTWAIEGKSEEYNPKITSALKLLKRVEVVLPDWINKIKDFIPRKEVLRWRREFPRFIEIIKCSAALHQFQRQSDKNGRVIADEKDYEIARQVIGKISASSGVEGLTHRERVGFEYVKEYYKARGSGCTRADIYAFKPIYSDRQWAFLLQKLAERGLLGVRLELNPESNRKANHYYPIELDNLLLPTFINLNKCSGSNGSKMQDITQSTFSSKDPNLSCSVIDNNYSITSITSTRIMILKNGKPLNLDLEAGKKYKKEHFGDDADKVIEILEKEGKIKLD